MKNYIIMDETSHVVKNKQFCEDRGMIWKQPPLERGILKKFVKVQMQSGPRAS